MADTKPNYKRISLPSSWDIEYENLEKLLDLSMLEMDPSQLIYLTV